jgi:hypothetical protein
MTLKEYIRLTVLANTRVDVPCYRYARAKELLNRIKGGREYAIKNRRNHNGTASRLLRKHDRVL